jgi:class 3 adenylate cyclase/tetratricopeptide (TPR) repeat protein
MTEAPKFDRGSPEAPRRRYLTILFSDLSDSTKIAGTLEAEDYSELLDQLRAIYHRVVAAQGGAIAQISGDGMLAVFGLPEPREDDGRRAVETALDLHEAVRALGGERAWGGTALRLHSGVHSGLVLFQEGDPVYGRYELLGSTTNIASRLCDLAGADQILVSDATLGPERHLFETAERSHLRLKGKDEPVATLAILGRAPIRSRYAASVRGGLTPFVGRAAELDALVARLDTAMAGETQFVAIEGPAGVGKTRLAEELLRRAALRGCAVHRGECEASAEPLQPFLEIGRSILGLTRPMPARAAAAAIDAALAALDPALLGHRQALIGALAPGLEDGHGRAARQNGGDGTAAALNALFDAVAAGGPLVQFIDDWHAADDASRELLTAQCNAGDRPLLLLVTVRARAPGDAPIAGPQALQLAPFSETETAAAVSCLLPAADPFTIASINDASGGNALFIEELCHSVASGAADEQPAQGSPWLDNLIGARLSRLPPAQADLVRAGAMIGKVIPSWLFEHVTGHGADDPLVTGLAAEDFIFPGEREGTLRFKHGITREAVYGSVGLHERKALHLTIADALRSRGAEEGEEPPYEALAYHFGAGGDDAETALYAELAGDKAVAVSALDRAQAQYKAALAALDRLPASDEGAYRWGRIAQRFGLAGVFDPSRDQLPIFERAVERARLRRDEAALAWAEYWLGYINYALGEISAAIRHCESALAAACRVQDDPLAVQIRATLGQARAAAADYDEALSLLDEAIAVKRRHRTGAKPPIGFSYSLSCKGFALGDLGRFDEAHACFEEAMAAIGGARHEVEGSVLCQRSAVCLWQGRPDDALRHADEAARVSERVRTLYLYAMSRALGAYARWLADGSPDAIDIVLRATAWLEESGRGQFLSLNYGWLAQMLPPAGRIAEGRRYAARAIWRARHRDRLGEAMAWRAMARAEKNSAVAARYLKRAVAAAGARSSPHEAAANLLCAADLAESPDALRAEAALAFETVGIRWPTTAR